MVQNDTHLDNNLGTQRLAHIEILTEYHYFDTHG